MYWHRVRNIGTYSVAMLAAILAVHTATAAAEQSAAFMLEMDCGSLTNAFGPFDYTNAEDVRQHLPIVETFHFSRDVENLTRGQSGEKPGGDLDYVLRAFPNHHRALYAMAKYHLSFPKMRIPPDANFSAECYLQRAVRFKSDDANVFVIYGLYLEKLGRNDDALERYRTAVEINPNSAEAHYNLGLLYLKLNRLDESAQHAETAYALGYPLMGLKRKLQSKGAWPDGSEG